MSRITFSGPWMEFDLGAEMQVLSWAINRPGLITARRILWREVRNADLPEDLDVHRWLEAELRGRAAVECPCMLTSRNVRRAVQARAEVAGVVADCVATVGLSNAERVGQRRDLSAVNWGTINVALRLNRGLTEAAMLEALSIVTQARTLAVVERGPILPGGAATGTGTDCIAIAAQAGDAAFAGLHTDIGEAVGKATYDAVMRATREWMIERPDLA